MEDTDAGVIGFDEEPGSESASALDRDAGVIGFDEEPGSESASALDRDAGVIGFDDYGAGSESASALDRDAGVIGFDDYGAGSELPESYYVPPDDLDSGGAYDAPDGRTGGKPMRPSPGTDDGWIYAHSSGGAARGAKIAADLLSAGASAAERVSRAVRGQDPRHVRDTERKDTKGDGSLPILGLATLLIFGS